MLKTREDITKANLAKTLTKMKKVVAEREELWLDWFLNALPLRIDVDTSRESIRARVIDCTDIADLALAEYEARWGQGGGK
jgi:hypothetical protein